MKVKAEEVKTWFSGNTAITIPALYLIINAAFFYVLWLSEIIPSIAAGQTPASISGTGLSVNPVHILDIAVFLPAFIISSVMLLRKEAVGYCFFPVMLVFALIMGIAILGMVTMMAVNGVRGETAMVVVFSVITAINALVLTVFMKGITEKAAAAKPGRARKTGR